MRKLYIILSLITFVCLPQMLFCQDEGEDPFEAACGVERWAVKVMTDADTSLMDFTNIVPTTIAEQKLIPAPPNISSAPPRQSTERTVYQLDCYMIFYKLEADQDIHIGIMSINHLDTMVAEICDPTCPGIITTSRYQKFKTLRDWFVPTYNPTTSFKTFLVRVKLTGVGFFDLLHGQRGIPPNGREIHSILAVQLVTGIGPNNTVIPAEFKLFQNYPNPFNPETKISYDIPISSYVSLKIYDNLGKEIMTLADGISEAGKQTKTFSAASLPSGVYYYRFTSDYYTETKKMLLIK